MLPQERDGVTLLVDVLGAGVKAGEDGVIIAIRRADDGRLLYTVEIDGPGGAASSRTVELDSTQFGLD